MELTPLKMALAGLIHDIGKFVDAKSMNISTEQVEKYADRYLPGEAAASARHHAAHTAAFIDFARDLLPPDLLDGDGPGDDALIDLAAGHHHPVTPLQQIIAVADRISKGTVSGTDFPDSAGPLSSEDAQKVRLVPLFEQLMRSKSSIPSTAGSFKFRYRLGPLTPQSIFPIDNTLDAHHTNDHLPDNYPTLIRNFIEGLKILTEVRSAPDLWYDYFDSLWLTYTSFVPALRSTSMLPDVPIYDHSRSTAAFATSLYLYHQATESLNAEAITDLDLNKFLIITGNFYGIQNFIFGGYGDSRKYRSKLLRGRSFAVSLFSDLAADCICKTLGLPPTSVIINAAGQFCVLAPNTKQAKPKVDEVSGSLNKWLVDNFYGESMIGFSTVAAASRDFAAGRFQDLWQRVERAKERAKYSKIDLDQHGGALELKDYLQKPNTSSGRFLCPICGKRPTHEEVEKSGYIKETGFACPLCRDHIYLGTNLAKKERLAVTDTAAARASGENRLFEPVYGKYQVVFPDKNGRMPLNAAADAKIWDIRVGSPGFERPALRKYLNGYVPRCTDDDHREIKTRFAGRERLEDLLEQITVGDPKTLELIALSAIHPADENGSHKGTDALGVLKADVDQLGILMACGLPANAFTLPRLTTLSRQLDNFFTVHLPHLLKNRTEFQNVYTVFSGGDDLFLIGPWNRIISLAQELRQSFEVYVCRNEHVHFSAGIGMHKSHTPMDTLAKAASALLENSKNSGRNRLSLFTETVHWRRMKELDQVKHTLTEWIGQGWINNAMLFRLNNFVHMATIEKKVVRENRIRMEDMGFTRWRALLGYFVERNVARSEAQAREDIVQMIAGRLAFWISEYRGELSLPVWEILYDNRKSGGS